MTDSNKNTIYWSLCEFDNWKLYMAATSKGLCYVGSPHKSFAEVTNWVKKRFPLVELVQNDAILHPYQRELVEYFQGTRQSFSFPIDTQGTAFQREIWNALNQIPYGKTVTYSQIAELIEKPQAVRAVGAAIGANPVLISVPCHRVIGKNGQLTGYRGGLEMKKDLLRLEKEMGK